MKLISENVHKRLLKSAEKTRFKFADKMIDKEVSVNAKIARELGFSLPAKVTEAIKKVDAMPKQKGRSRCVNVNVPLSEYLTKLEAYKPDAQPANPNK